jgi:RNA polymerase sigma-70 factor (ECF subfamily)
MAKPIDVEAYYKRYGPMVLRRCRRLLGDEELALDAMQDTFVNLLNKQAQLKHQAPSSLLFRIATNVCLNRIRTIKRHPEDPRSSLLSRIASIDEPESSSAARFILSKLLGGEPESIRIIAVLHLLDGFSHEQVAREVGLSPSGVRRRLKKLQAKLVALEGVPS